MKTKKLISLLLSAILLIGILPATSLAAGETLFTDIKMSDWFYDGVQYACERGMMNGTGNGRFSPNETTTRGMIVTILHRLEGAPTANGTTFSDVPIGKWYTDAVGWASSTGIINGYGNGKFGPEDTITREQMAAILLHYANYKGYDVSASTSLSKYTDSAQISSYAVESMSWASAAELITGTTNTTLSPKGSATRAQVAVILMRFCEQISPTLTTDDLEKYFNTTNAIEETAKEYLDENGFVAENKVTELKSAIVNEIKMLISEEKIKSYSVEDSNIWMELTSGIQYVYIFPIKGASAVGNTGTLSIITYEPFSNWWETERPDTNQGANGEAATDGVARKIESAFDNYQFTHNYDDNAVTLDRVRELGDNQIVLWDGHGGFTSNNHSFIALGEQLDEIAFLLDPIYYLQNLNYTTDYLSGAIICTNLDNRIAIGYKFIEKYVSSMNNSFIYLGACETGKDSVFAEAFLNKGATAVVANSETVLTDYTQAMEREICLKMLEINPQTKQYYTLSEALAYAKQIHGRTDGSQYNAEVIIFGGTNANNYRLVDTADKVSQINYYEVFNGVADTWEMAQQYCESRGGHLATLTSQEENNYVYQQMVDAGYESAYFGLTDVDTEGTWKWITGEPSSYQNWHNGEPNSENQNEDYAMFYYKYSDGTWNDGDFGGRTVNSDRAFICEWDTEAAYQSYCSAKDSKPSDVEIIDVLLSHEEMWADQIYKDEPDEWALFDFSQFAYFHDFDFDGIPEFVIQSYMYSSANFTNRTIYKIQGNSLQPIQADGWDDFEVRKDIKTGTYFHIGHDYSYINAREQYVGWTENRYAKVSLMDSSLVSEQIYAICQDTFNSENIDYYGSIPNISISKAEYDYILQELEDTTINLGFETGNLIETWDSSASYKNKEEILLNAYHSVFNA